MNDLKETISKNITKLRKEKKLTQFAFANKLNYSDKAISKWERGESIPDIITLKQIADFFGVTVDYMLTKHENESALQNTTHETKNIKNEKENTKAVTIINSDITEKSASERISLTDSIIQNN